jgi:hypothetical protein
MGRLEWDLDEAVRRQHRTPPLWHEPVRGAMALAAAVTIIGAFLPFATGHIPDARGMPRPVSWSGFDGSADGGILLAIALIAVYVAVHRGIAESAATLAVLAPFLVGLFAAFTTLNAHREASAAVAGWERSNGEGSLGPGMLLALVSAPVLFGTGAWLTAAGRNRVDPTDRWHVSGRAVAESVGGTIGGVVGFMAALLLTSSRLHAMLTPLMLVASLIGALAGVWIGARLGALLAAQVRRR